MMYSSRRIMTKFKCCASGFVLLTLCCARVDSEFPRNGAPVQLPSPEQNVMPYEPVQYSQANISNNYKSSTKYNAKGMGHLYYITNKFLNFLLKEQAYPEGFVRAEDGTVVFKKDWMSLAWHYRSLVLIVGVGLALSAIVPMAGLVFCCCRCAGKCGARTAPFDSRYDTCRRHFLGLVLSVLTTLILFGVVCAFVTNEQIEDGTKNLAPNVRTSLRDTDLYLNNTKLQVNTLLITNFKELEIVLDKLLHRSGEIVRDKLGEISKATVLANLTTIVSGLKSIRSDLNNIDSLTKPLREHANSLESALTEVRVKLLSQLEMCRNERPCIDFLSKYNITALSLEANFTQLPDVTTSLHNVSALLADNIEEEVLKGKDQFDRIKYNIQISVDRRIPEISKEISKAGQMLNEKAKNVTRILENIQNVLYKDSYEPIARADSFLLQYSQSRYYTGLGMSSTLLIILCCIAFGLLCGYCGHRPDALYNDDCCDKGTASRCLILSVWLMLLTFSSLMVLCLVYLVTGTVADRVVCTSLRQPSTPNNAFTLIDNLVQLPPYTSSNPPPLSQIIRECHHNSSVYKALGLDLDSLSEYTSERFDIPKRVKQLADSIVLTSEIQIITPQAEKQLRALAASPLNTIDLTVYTSVLNEKITSIDLLQMAAALNQTAIRLPQSQESVRTVLLNKAMYLEIHQERQVSIMAELAGWLDGNATLLSRHLKFNHSSLSQAIDSLLTSVFQAQALLNSKGPAIVHTIAEEFGVEFSRHIDSYLERVQTESYNNVGRCWPLSQVYNATIVSACNAIVDPFNGFWLSVGCTVFLFLPVIVVAIKLSTLYQKSDPYPGPLVEAEYLYDAYGDNRDSTPLANIEKKKRKKKKSTNTNRDSRYDNSVSYSAHLSRTERSTAPPPADSTWEVGNPPRYQGPEYERPPPYYFPSSQQ